MVVTHNARAVCARQERAAVAATAAPLILRGQHSDSYVRGLLTMSRGVFSGKVVLRLIGSLSKCSVGRSSSPEDSSSRSDSIAVSRFGLPRPLILLEGPSTIFSGIGAIDESYWWVRYNRLWSPDGLPLGLGYQLEMGYP
jgi:hypothetical protein